MIDLKNSLGGCCSTFKVADGEGADKIEDLEGIKKRQEIYIVLTFRINQSENAIVTGRMLRGWNDRLCRATTQGHDFHTISQYPPTTTLVPHLDGEDGSEIIATIYNV